MVSAQVAERSVLTLEIWGSYPVIGKCISVNKWQICTIRHVFLQKSLLIAIKSSGTKQKLILRVTFQLRQMLCSVVDDCDVWPNECRYGQTGIGWPNGRRYGQTNVGMAKRTPWSSVFWQTTSHLDRKRYMKKGGANIDFQTFTFPVFHIFYLRSIGPTLKHGTQKMLTQDGLVPSYFIQWQII